MNEQTPLLRLHDVSVSRGALARPSLAQFSLAIAPAETIAVLGEAGCGKEALVNVLGGYWERGEQVGGTLQVRDGPPERAGKRNHGGLRIACLPGPAPSPLSPAASALSQFARIIARKLDTPKAAARAEFDLVLQRLPGAPSIQTFEKRPGALAPEFLAWGLLAASLAQTPDLLVADDPFSRLGPTQSRALIRALMAEQKRTGFALLYAAMTTDVVTWLGGRVIVLRGGKIVEEGPVTRLASDQAHAYTRTLFKAMPQLSDVLAPPRSSVRGEPVLQVYGLTTRTAQDAGKGAAMSARDGLNFELRRGASLSLVGERGSGRRALSRVLLGLERAATGRVVLDAVDIGILSEVMKTRLRRRVAFISGADNALDPRMRVWDTVDEPLRAHLRLPREVLAESREAALKRVGLASIPGHLPVAQLSPFDRRRLQVARAIVSAPLLAVVDEPLRGLDAFARSVMRDLLREFRSQEGPAFLVITTDFTVAHALSEETMVLQDGKVIERGAVADVLRNPGHAYTKMLIDAVSAVRPQSVPVTGQPAALS